MLAVSTPNPSVGGLVPPPPIGGTPLGDLRGNQLTQKREQIGRKKNTFYQPQKSPIRQSLLGR